MNISNIEKLVKALLQIESTTFCDKSHMYVLQITDYWYQTMKLNDQMRK